ncbi:MAG: TetR/AcrR family transcriptional regulator [Ardenticatenaceae bacterium]|nr:TetR/AcrR family transcriptional regulator [Ardenticatenaceae bacterium]MCB9445420.1 TetR/AcrR family transcriptional regulator [Ardenticatenaceae bacterium]
MIEATSAKERVLNVAEELFHERGYTAVSMRDIADALEMRQASLYYHVPDGKEQLFVEVTERGLHRHQDGLAEAIQKAEPKIETQLKAAANWFASHMPMKLLSMLETDMLAISAENSQKLVYMAYEAMFMPIANLFAEAMDRGEVRRMDPNRLSGHFLALMDGVSYTSTAGHALEPIDQLVDDMIDVFLYGAYPR